jgi:cytidine deaminase
MYIHGNSIIVTIFYANLYNVVKHIVKGFIMNDKMQNLINSAKEVVGIINMNGFDGNGAGHVAAAILSKSGNIYTGINIDTACSLGFCAEASAIADMLKHKETEIVAAVAVTFKGDIIPPCGRCRELMYQINKDNINAEIATNSNTIKVLKDLLPETWADQF